MATFVWVLAGIPLAGIYWLLAGWQLDTSPLVILATPAIVMMWFILAIMTGAIHTDNPRGRLRINWRAAVYQRDARFFAGRDMRHMLWWWTAFALAPIMMRGLAHGCEAVGWTSLAGTLFELRYLTWLIIPGVLLLLALLAGAGKAVQENLGALARSLKS
jgi:hypothetical protein